MSQHILELFDLLGREKTLDQIQTEIMTLDPQSVIIIISGKEPSLHSRFFEIVSLAATAAKHHIIMYSDGEHLSTHPLLQKICTIPNLNIFLTPFSTDLFNQGMATLFNQTYSKRLGAIQILLGMNARIAAWIPILPHNVQHLKDIVLGLSNIGLSNIILSFPPLSPNQHTHPRYSDLHHHISEAINAVPFVVTIENVPACMLGIEFDHASSFIQINDAQKIKPAPCTNCARNDSCPGIYQTYLSNFGNNEIHAINEDGSQQTPHTPTTIHPVISASARIYDHLQSIMGHTEMGPSPDEILRFLYAISDHTSSDHPSSDHHSTNHPLFWSLIETTGYPLPIVKEITTALENEGIASLTGDEITLTKPLPRPLPARDFSKHRLPSNPALCQLRVSHNDLARRCAYIIERCPSGGRIAMLGDDDFMSLTLASTEHFDEVVVFEIDEGIVEAIATIAQQESLRVTAICHDLRYEIPVRFWKLFDAFYTDCPYTSNGFSLFASRGVSLLRPRAKKHGFVSFSPELPSMEQVELPVQAIISDMGLYIEHKKEAATNCIPPEFSSRYPTPQQAFEALNKDADTLSTQDQWYLGALGRKEYLFHFLTTRLTKPLIRGFFSKGIYYDQTPLSWMKKAIKKI